MQPGQWAMMNLFDNSMLAQVPPLIDRVQAAFDTKNIVLHNVITLLQLGLEHFHPYIAGMLWMMGLEAMFDSGGKELFQKALCDCLGEGTPVFPNWHGRYDAPAYTVGEIAIPLYVLRNKLAHGADLSSAATDKRYPVDLLAPVSLTQDAVTVNYASVLSEAACHLLCQVLNKRL